LRKGRFVLGLLCLVGAVFMYYEISSSESQNVSPLPIFSISFKQEVQMCNSGWGDIMGITFQCVKIQVIYYSPWILGIIGIILLIKSRSHYYGHRRNRYY
jgi:hypothetical protein